jgi:predicted transposase YbfD/YdcC
MSIEIMSYFSEIEDPRIERQKKYSLSEILFLILISSLCGVTNYVDMEDFGNSNRDWFSQYYNYANGIPSHDTLGRLMRLIDPVKFKTCFIDWVQTLYKKVEDIIAIDGKNLRHSFDNGDTKSSIYMISAWSCESGLVLGQEKVNSKSNEITSIPKLLDILDISGSIVTIDAMGCQHEIASKIKSQGGDYFLSLKGNQGNLHKDIKEFFEDKELIKETKLDVFECVNYDHGRIETRKCTVVNEVSWLKNMHNNFNTIESIIKVDSIREFKSSNKATEYESRYYISSKAQSAEKALTCCRNHWQIENKLHWVLDMNFDEDQSRVRKDHSPENMAIIRHTALNMINNFKKINNLKISIRRIQNKFAWNKHQLDELLKQKF